MYFCPFNIFPDELLTTMKKLHTAASIAVFFFVLLYTVFILGKDEQESSHPYKGKEPQKSDLPGSFLSDKSLNRQ